MQSSTYNSRSSSTAPIVEKVLLPTQIVEKPVAIHEEIRREVIEEVQPVVNVEKLKTEVHQVTQPLFDKEVKSVQIENRTLATEVLPEVLLAGRGINQQADYSTTKYLDTTTVVVEKPALINEIERKQIIEEIQPVVYKETIVPEVIQETKPIYQKIVEGPVYSQTTLAAKGVANPSAINPGYVPDRTVVAPINERVLLPTQVVEKPVAIHEEIRKEVIEEIQPVINVEKIKTEVHQITAPLFDKEVRPVEIQKRVLATEVLPEVLVDGRGMRAVDDLSTTTYQATNKVIVEKPAQFREVERTQIIEEIQPVVYKETVVPHVIKETKPMYQKIVEGPVYTQTVLPAQSLAGSNYALPRSVEPAPVVVEKVIVVEPVMVVPVAAPVAQSIPIRDDSDRSATLPVQMQATDKHRTTIIEDTFTTTTTTTVAPVVGANMGPGNYSSAQPHKHGLFHRRSKDLSNNDHLAQQQVQGPYGTTAAPLAGPAVAPLGSTLTNSSHTEKQLNNGAKVVEDTVSTSTHSQRVVPRT